MSDYTPTETAIALSLYAYNVRPIERAEKLHDHFGGECPTMEELYRVMQQPAYAPTELPFPTFEVYLRQALSKCGEEARRRVRASRAYQRGDFSI
jgi:hypothetical protein